LPEYSVVLIEKQLIQFLVSLVEHGYENVKFQCAKVLGILSSQNAKIADMLTKNAVLLALQSLMTSSRDDVISYAGLSACNVAPAYFTANNSSPAEVTLLTQVTRFHPLN
jgi:hypothetical protein